MKHLLVYLPLANEHRAPILQQMAERYIKLGYVVSIIIESRICVFRNNEYIGDSVHNHTIAKYIDFDIFNDVFYLKLPKVKPENWGSIEGERLEYYQNILSVNVFSEVLVWNGNFDYQQVFLNLLKQYPQINIMYMEVAWFDQNNSVYIDPLGVNAKSQLSKITPPKLTPLQLSKVNKFINNYSAEFENVKKNKNNKLKILVPLQVDTDSNIINHSPFKNMKSFIDFLESWLPKENIEVTIRAHPKAKYDYEIYSKRSDFIIENKGNIKSKIAETDIVIGINSTALVQSLAFGKKVIAFGDGIFSSSKAICKMDLTDTFQIPKALHFQTQEFIYFLLFTQQISIKRIKKNNIFKYIYQYIK